MCGFVGVISSTSVKQKIFDALLMLQHRGQDAAGILTCDGQHMSIRKANGLIVEAIRAKHMKTLNGNIGIGHVRYPTAGSDSVLESQPFYVNFPYGIALSHNGNLVNTDQIKSDLLEKDHRHVVTTSDSELLLNVLASEIHSARDGLTKFSEDMFFNAMKNVYKRCVGGYAAVGIILGVGLFAFRDPNGIRPLIIGRKLVEDKYEYMLASESVALDCNGFELMGDIKAGEAIFIDFNGHISRKICSEQASFKPCIFEYVYLARPDSIMNGVSVHDVRVEMGKAIANRIISSVPNHDIDVVIPVPDSGRYSAQPIADLLGVKYCEGFVKNRYIGRTFIMPNQTQRQTSIRRKLNPINSEFIGKHVLLVDDSIVRGNTSKLIVKMAYDAGAKKVSIVSASPVVKYPNVYGIDMPTHDELIGYNKSIKEIKNWLGVEHLFYQTQNDLI